MNASCTHLECKDSNNNCSTKSVFVKKTEFGIGMFKPGFICRLYR